MSVPTRTNISRVRGDTYAFGIIAQNDAGVVVDLTGCTVAVTVYDRVSGAVLATLAGVIALPATGAVTFSPDATMAALEEDIYDYRIALTDGSAKIRTVMLGRWTVEI